MTCLTGARVFVSCDYPFGYAITGEIANSRESLFFSLWRLRWPSPSTTTAMCTFLFGRMLSPVQVGAHLTDWANKERDALVCQLNSYLGSNPAVDEQSLLL